MYLNGQFHALSALAPGEQASVSVGWKCLELRFSPDVMEKYLPYEEFDPTSLDLQLCQFSNC